MEKVLEASNRANASLDNLYADENEALKAVKQCEEEIQSSLRLFAGHSEQYAALMKLRDKLVAAYRVIAGAQ